MSAVVGRLCWRMPAGCVLVMQSDDRRQKASHHQAPLTVRIQEGLWKPFQSLEVELHPQVL